MIVVGGASVLTGLWSAVAVVLPMIGDRPALVLIAACWALHRAMALAVPAERPPPEINNNYDNNSRPPKISQTYYTFN